MLGAHLSTLHSVLHLERRKASPCPSSYSALSLNPSTQWARARPHPSARRKHERGRKGAYFPCSGRGRTRWACTRTSALFAWGTAPASGVVEMAAVDCVTGGRGLGPPTHTHNTSDLGAVCVCLRAETLKGIWCRTAGVEKYNSSGARRSRCCRHSTCRHPPGYCSSLLSSCLPPPSVSQEQQEAQPTPQPHACARPARQPRRTRPGAVGGPTWWNRGCRRRRVRRGPLVFVELLIILLTMSSMFSFDARMTPDAVLLNSLLLCL